MGFLTILNNIAMGIGYVVSLLGIIVFIWISINTIKDKLERKKWKRERADKEKVQNTLEKEKQEVVQPVAATTTTNQTSVTKQTPVQTTQQTTEKQNTAQQPQTTTQTSTTNTAYKKEEPKQEDQNKEKLVDEGSKIKMVG